MCVSRVALRCYVQAAPSDSSTRISRREDREASRSPRTPFQCPPLWFWTGWGRPVTGWGRTPMPPFEILGRIGCAWVRGGFFSSSTGLDRVSWTRATSTCCCCCCWCVHGRLCFTTTTTTTRVRGCNRRVDYVTRARPRDPTNSASQRRTDTCGFDHVEAIGST